MGWSAVILLVVAACLLIYLFIEFKRMKHKFVAIFLIILILFFYATSLYVFKGQKVDLTSASGLMKASGIYLSWLGHAFGNVMVITSDAIKMNWETNETSASTSK